MNRATALKNLSAHKAQIVRRFGVASLALFGSTARDDAKPDSDIDLVTEKALRPELRPHVLKDAVHV